MIQLKFRDAKPIYEQVRDGMKQMIYQNILVPEEKLPSVREMASKLAINPNTISRAYRELEQEGFVYTTAGVGTFVNTGINLAERRTKELYEEFDEVTKQLLYYVEPKELQDRVQRMSEGGEVNDSGQ